MKFQYPMTIKDIVEANEMFDECVIRIAYAGKNRNGSVIAKEVFEKAAESMKYCPIVTNYDAETDTFGGHDMAVVERDGGLKLVNLTDGIGVIPENPEYFWETITEDNGEEHEYLNVRGILWKRSAAYETIKATGTVDQSMEIRIKDGHKSDDGYVIDDFVFTAFAIIGVTPCFESADVHFSDSGCENRLSAMLEDFKMAFSMVTTASADDNTISKGGDSKLNIEELMEKYGLSAEDIKPEELDGLDKAEIEAKFEALRQVKDEEDVVEDPEPEPGLSEDGEANDSANTEDATNTESEPEQTEEENGNGTENSAGDESYALAMQERETLDKALAQHSFFYAPWGETRRKYWLEDFDATTQTAYVFDSELGYMVRMAYTRNNDDCVIDIDSAVRVKLAYVDWVDGEDRDAGFAMYSGCANEFNAVYERLSQEKNELLQFKQHEMDRQYSEQVSAVFSKFEDLNGTEAFEALKESVAEHKNLSVEDVEEKCFALRGRAAKTMTFSAKGNPVRIPIDRIDNANTNDEPYNGIFQMYGFVNK